MDSSSGESLRGFENIVSTREDHREGSYKIIEDFVNT